MSVIIYWSVLVLYIISSCNTCSNLGYNVPCSNLCHKTSSLSNFRHTAHTKVEGVWWLYICNYWFYIFDNYSTFWLLLMGQLKKIIKIVLCVFLVKNKVPKLCIYVSKINIITLHYIGTHWLTETNDTVLVTSLQMLKGVLVWDTSNVRIVFRGVILFRVSPEVLK